MFPQSATSFDFYGAVPHNPRSGYLSAARTDG
jgi:hypothetical protein